MTDALTEEEMRRWVAWKRAADSVWDAVVAAIGAATGLSAPDFSVLTRVAEEGGGSLRQQRLADELGWERSRLSRQLERMEQRGLISRSGSRTEWLVELTPDGAAAARHARAAHADAVRATLLRAAPEDAAAFWRTIEQLSS
ncbi:MarR family winged helix-turn-helix transcriptional regulator [Amnibacterium kyonggiense]